MYQIDHAYCNNAGCGGEGTPSKFKHALHSVEHIFRLPALHIFILVVYFLSAEHCLAQFNPQLAVMNCNNCHPKAELSIYRENTEQLYATLLQFKYEQRPALIMNRINKGFSDNELRQIAEFISQADDH